MVRLGVLLLVCVVMGCASATRGVREVGRGVGEGRVELRGVGAGEVVEGWWREGRLNFVADVRSPLVTPLPGKFRNIYAPSVVALPDGSFRVFYGGWDGVGTGNDRIYSVMADGEFQAFTDRRIVVEHGPFEHVCNVSAVREGDGSYLLACTAYPDAKGLNKVAVFRVPAEMPRGPIVAAEGDLVSVEGYAGYAAGDLNGMNPIVMETGGRVHLYFGNFRDFGRVYRAVSGDGGRTFRFEGVALEFAGMPNDVKRVGDVTLMALHRNGGELYYAVSRDGERFDGVRVLGKSLSGQDRYMVAVGLVVRDRKVLGYLYGAGAAASLDRNRIFARWLQRKVVLVTEDGRRVEAKGALGPDRVMMEVEGEAKGRLEVYAEDGATLLNAYDGVTLREGRAYSLRR